MGKTASTITADEAKQRLKNGEPLEGVKLDRITLAKGKFSGPIIITECEIEHLDLNASTFEGDVIIRRCKIRQLVLSAATFEKACDIKKSTVSRIRCQEATFKAGFHGSEATLGGSFHKSVFVGKADFGWSTFTSDAQFTEAQFQSDVDFRNTRVTGNGLFERSHCQGSGMFSDSVFEGDLRMRSSAWDRDLNFLRAQVKLGLDLALATLGGVTDLRDMVVGRTVNLNRVQLGPQQGFRFMGLVASTVDLQRLCVEGHVHPEQQKNHRASADEYGFLRIMFQHIHRYEDEDWAYYQFKKAERKSKFVGWNPIRLLIRACNYLFLDLGCGYGTKPFRTLFVCGLMVIFFALLYLIPLGDMIAANPAELRYHTGVPSLNYVLQGFDYSLMAFSGNYPDIPFTEGWRILAMLEYLLGVVFLGLFVVALSRKVIR